MSEEISPGDRPPDEKATQCKGGILVINYNSFNLLLLFDNAFGE